MSIEDIYQRARRRARLRPKRLLERRVRRIVKQKCPTTNELAELAAIRTELRLRSIRTPWRL